MIASLEDQKADCLHRFEAAIQSLKELQEMPAPDDTAPHRRTLSFQPIEIDGEPLSKTVIDARGPY